MTPALQLTMRILSHARTNNIDAKLADLIAKADTLQTTLTDHDANIDADLAAHDTKLAGRANTIDAKLGALNTKADAIANALTDHDQSTGSGLIAHNASLGTHADNTNDNVAGLNATIATLGQQLHTLQNLIDSVPLSFWMQIQPDSATEGGPDFTLTVLGNNFVSGSTVHLNGSPRTTLFVSSSEIQASISASDIASAGNGILTVPITVLNPAPDGRTTIQVPFVIVSASVGDVDSTSGVPGETTTSAILPDTLGEAGLSASLTNNGVNTSPTTVTAATYTKDPNSTGVLDVGGGYVDLKVDRADPSDVLNASFYYPDTVTGTTETELLLLYYTGSAWEAVRSSGDVAPVKVTDDNLDGTVSGGRFSVTFDNSSIPKITELTGTVLTMTPDNTPPVIVPSVTGTLGINGWYISGVVVSWSVTDVQSDIASTNGCDTFTVVIDTASNILICEASSDGGTELASITIKRDTTPPVVIITTPADVSQYDSGATILGDWSVSDALGIDTFSATTPNEDPIDTSGLGIKSYTVSATDFAGHSASVTHTYEVVRLEVAIDIQPGDDANSVNLGSNGVISVGVISGTYSGVFLDATTIIGSSLVFEGNRHCAQKCAPGGPGRCRSAGLSEPLSHPGNSTDGEFRRRLSDRRNQYRRHVHRVCPIDNSAARQ